MTGEKKSGADLIRSRQLSARAERLAAALKENLRKRKDQARQRLHGIAPEGDAPLPDPISPQSSGSSPD